jgi:hypothetical protein
MTPVLTFFIGLAILVLFGWYFASESDRLRRILGTVLTIVVSPREDPSRPRPSRRHFVSDSAGAASKRRWWKAANYKSDGRSGD